MSSLITSELCDGYFFSNMGKAVPNKVMLHGLCDYLHSFCCPGNPIHLNPLLCLPLLNHTFLHNLRHESSLASFKYLIRISQLYLVMGFIMTFSDKRIMYICHIHFPLPSHLSPTPADLLQLLLLSLPVFMSILCDPTSFLRGVPISTGERAFYSSMGISSVTTLL